VAGGLLRAVELLPDQSADLRAIGGTGAADGQG